MAADTTTTEPREPTPSESERLLTTAANTLRQLASNLDVSATYATPRGGGDRG